MSDAFKCPHCDAEMLTHVGRSIMFKCETTSTDGIIYKRHNRCRINELEWTVDKLQKRIDQLEAELTAPEATYPNEAD